MSSIGAAAAVLVFNAVNKVKGGTVVYQTFQFSSSGSTFSVRMNFGKPNLVTDFQIAAKIEAESVDGLVLTGEFTFGGTPVIPLENDRWFRTLNGRNLTYQVQTPPYRPSDSQGQILRIHGKLISVM